MVLSPLFQFEGPAKDLQDCKAVSDADLYDFVFPGSYGTFCVVAWSAFLYSPFFVFIFSFSV